MVPMIVLYIMCNLPAMWCLCSPASGVDGLKDSSEIFIIMVNLDQVKSVEGKKVIVWYIACLQ